MARGGLLVNGYVLSSGLKNRQWATLKNFINSPDQERKTRLSGGGPLWSTGRTEAQVIPTGPVYGNCAEEYKLEPPKSVQLSNLKRATYSLSNRYFS
jgi:hypothetical protein